MIEELQEGVLNNGGHGFFPFLSLEKPACAHSPGENVQSISTPKVLGKIVRIPDMRDGVRIYTFYKRGRRPCGE